ncbi:hypothetical protein L1987_03002 [Smallanthus sonchifolius]|uniref:Uncharacterized protein n=1 Tax=Smallanthus sonchifolius TaxID=185202 RepID=A0ACB9K9D2_9ASTR|nr:hypothetical protein L1987_03002 [Smallanthus sonchifolius]
MPKSPASSPKFPLPSRSTASPAPRFSISRCPSELGCVQSLLPLHNAVAAARLTSCLSTTSRSCRSLSQDYHHSYINRIRPIGFTVDAHDFPMHERNEPGFTRPVFISNAFDGS